MNMPETEISRFYPLVLNINERNKAAIGFKLSSRLSSFFAETFFNTMIPLKLFLSSLSTMRPQPTQWSYANREALKTQQ